jgi:hypothetical protein
MIARKLFPAPMRRSVLNKHEAIKMVEAELHTFLTSKLNED